MKENARQGFWNGSRAPIGYRVVAAEQRGAKTKKRLEIDPLGAETVRLIFRLFLEGTGNSGPLGIKSIVKHLNETSIRTRDGGRWGLAAVHKVLTRTTYVGRHRFNLRCLKTGERKPETEVVEMAVPPLIGEAEFQAVQERLKLRSPAFIAPRIVSGPTLLTGICFCARCGGAMTLRTSGKGKQYRYYTCSTTARQGQTGCKGHSVPMDKLDGLVAAHLENRLLDPERLETFLAAVLHRRQEWAERRQSQVTDLRRRATEAEAKLKRLYDAIEAGIADLADPMLKARIGELTALRDQARVKVDENEVRIIGAKTALLRTLAAASGAESAAFGVRGFVPKWRPLVVHAKPRRTPRCNAAEEPSIPKALSSNSYRHRESSARSLMYPRVLASRVSSSRSPATA